MDHTGYERVYSGIVGFGVQILFTVSMLAHQAFAGVEALWFTQTKNNNFGNGLMPWCYFFAGGGQGLLIDVSKVLSISFLNNPQKVLRTMGLGFSCSVSFSFFLIKAQQMSSPFDYTRTFTFSSVTTMGITVSKASGGKISTYGVGFSLEKGGLSVWKKIFGVARGASFYWQIPIGPNARTLYSYVQRRV